jgi:Domain of unknown function (DUF5979)
MVNEARRGGLPSEVRLWRAVPRPDGGRSRHARGHWGNGRWDTGLIVGVVGAAIAVVVAASVPVFADGEGSMGTASTLPADDGGGAEAPPTTASGGGGTPDSQAPAPPPPDTSGTTATETETTPPRATAATPSTAPPETSSTVPASTEVSATATPTDAPLSGVSACAAQGTERVVTNQSEYDPGSTVHITGADYAAACVARIDISAAENGVAPVAIEVETSADGQLATDHLLDGAPGSYEVLVLGVEDAVLASTTFTVMAEEPSPPTCAPRGTERVATDQREYTPGSTVHITGDGYATSCDLRVVVTRPDGAAVTARASLESGASPSSAGAANVASTGAFRYVHALDDEVTGQYEVRVLGPDDAVFASTSFTVADPEPTSCTRLGTETIATDQPDYPPGATVHMTGAGYAPSCLVRVEVTRPDGSVVKGDGSFAPGVDEVLTSTAGTLVYDYVLNGIEGMYQVRVLGAGGAVLASTTFTDQIRAAPSDPRATFVLENLTTCAEVGFPDDVQVGAQGSAAAGDQFVQGTVTGSAPTMLQVEITPEGTAAGVVVDAVVVKGSNGSNVYTDPSVLPPALPPPQDYISPLTNEDFPIADISHWYICYRLAEPLEDGALLVLKRVVPPPGPPVEPLPTEYTVDVTCTLGDATIAEETLTFGRGGGVGATPGGAAVITGLPVGTVCTVVEQGTDTFPDGTVVAYLPPTAPNPGVEIGEGPGAIVAVVNDFSGVEVLTGSLQVTKVLIPPPAGVDMPNTFTVEVACSDDTLTEVTVPTRGSATVEDITADAYCLVVERTGSLPPELEVTYSPSPLPERLSIVRVAENTTIEVTITNDASNIPTTTTTTTTTAPPTTTTTCPSAPGVPPVTVTDPADCPAVGAGGGTTTPPGGLLPVTGGGPEWAIGALLAVALGALLTLLARRPTAGSTNGAGRHFDN